MQTPAQAVVPAPVLAALLVPLQPPPDPLIAPDQLLDQAAPPPGHQGAGAEVRRGEEGEYEGQEVITPPGLQTLEYVHHHKMLQGVTS